MKRFDKKKMKHILINKIIVIRITFFLIAFIIVFLSCYFYNFDSKTLKNELIKYNNLDNKKILVYGTSIGVNSNGDFNNSYIKLISDKNNMKLTNRSQSGCTGVYISSKKNSGYFKYIRDLSKEEIRKYDFIIVEGFANDAENKNIQIDTFKKELTSALKHLKQNKGINTKIIVVTTPKLPSGYGKNILERQNKIWGEAKKISKKNGINYCNTYYTEAYYKNINNDHPTDEGQKNIAKTVEKCMLTAE